MPACLTLLCAGAARGGEEEAEQDLPKFEAIAQAVEQHFQAQKGYRAGDLISRGDVEPLWGRLAEMGWEVADEREIAELLLDDRNLLVRELRTHEGRKFMRQIARTPQAYDRLERLSGLTDGRRLLGMLIEGPDGYKLLVYLTSTPGGTEMGRMLSEAPNGKDFNKPTGHIYTAEQFLDRLERSYSAAVALKR